MLPAPGEGVRTPAPDTRRGHPHKQRSWDLVKPRQEGHTHEHRHMLATGGMSTQAGAGRGRQTLTWLAVQLETQVLPSLPK